jgi:CubicO group peptidase (beta-lactamase class C family)
MKRLVSTLALLTVAAAPACGSDGSEPRELPPFDLAAGGSSSNAPGSSAPGTATPGATPGAAVPGGSELGGPGEGAPVVGQMQGQTPVTGSVTTAPLPRSTPEAEGVDSQGLLALVTALDDSPNEVHSVMLARHGKVVAEGWWAPYAAQDIHVLYSVTKSVNGTAVGFAVQEGLLSIDDLLLSRFPDIAPAAPDANLSAMRVRDLLTMSTGHAADTIDRLRQRTDGQWTRAFLELPVENPPGAPFIYNSGAAYVLGSLVQKVTGMTVKEYLTPRLFEPLGIINPFWAVQPSEGVNLTEGGLSMRTEDMVKFGQFYLQKGQWNGAQLLSEQWVADATSSEVSNGTGQSDWNSGYGYQFWRNQRGGFRADGSLAQFSFVLPEQDAVIAVTSGTTDLKGVVDIVFQNLLPALRAEALPDNPTAQQALKQKLAALALPLPSGTPTSARSADVSGRVYTTAANSYGVQSVQLDFSATPNPVLTIQDADGPHAIPVGLSDWVRSRTGYRKRINELFDTPEQGIAARGAWSDDSTFTTKIVFNETPYTMNTTYRFEGEQVFINTTYNVRWGAATEAQITGTR